MKKTLGRAALMTALMTAAFTFSSFAATQITSVKFTADIDDNEAVTSGLTSPTFSSDEEDIYDVYSEETSTGTSAKSERTYKLTFTANGDYEFPSNTDSITVQGTGIQSITSKKVKDDGATLEVKVKAWPYYQLEEPEVTTEPDDSTKKLAFDKKGAGTIEYYIVYVDKNGESHTKHSTTTSSSISLSSYYKTATAYVSGYAIRATKLASSSNPYIVPSNWVKGGEEPDGDLDEYETWGDWIGNKSSSSSSSSGSTINNTSSSAGWTGSGNDWYYKNSSGKVQTGWVQDGSNWYYCDPSNGGKMKAGWLHDTDGNWYYLNESHDGTYGRMMTSWQTINGVNYYFRPNAGGPLGSMVSNATVSINGVRYTFNADGARIG